MIELFAPVKSECAGVVKLQVHVIETTVSSMEYDIWFKTDEKWGDYYCDDRLDGFLIMVLCHAMITGQDIKCNAPVSESILYQIRSFQMPCVQKYIYHQKNITIDAEPIEDLRKSGNERVVATGASNGVDSMYTIFKHLYGIEMCENFAITHLAYFTAGAAGDFGGEEANELAIKRLHEVQRFSDKIGLPLVCLESNISEIFDEIYVNVFSYRLMGSVLILQKLFDVYYVSTGVEISEFAFNDSDTSYYDLLNCTNMSTPKTRFYSFGLESSRMDKLKYIAQFDLSREFLQVCQTSYDNCCRCEKCYRTMAELDAIGCIESFGKVFDLKYYQEKRDRILGNGFAHWDIHSHWKEVYVAMKNNNWITGKIRAWHLYYFMRARIAKNFRTFAAKYKKMHENKLAGSSEQYKDLYVRL